MTHIYSYTVTVVAGGLAPSAEGKIDESILERVGNAFNAAINTVKQFMNTVKQFMNRVKQFVKPDREHSEDGSINSSFDASAPFREHSEDDSINSSFDPSAPLWWFRGKPCFRC